MIQPNRFNPNVMQDEEFQALKKDMQVHGPVGIDPVLVSPFNAFYLSETKSRDDYVIIDGEHRWKAAKELLWDKVRCEIREVDEEEAKGICYRKNKDRGTIDPFKEAALFKSELEVGLGQKEIAEKFLVDASTVSHRLSLLKLESEVVTQVNVLPRGTLSASHLEVIATLQPPDQKKVIEDQAREFKNCGRISSVSSLSDQAERIREQRKMEAKLHEALKTAKYPKCLKCKAPPGRINFQGLPWVNCSANSWDSEHTWNIETGKPKYEPVRVREGLDKQKRPEFSRVIRSNYTVKELSQAFFKSIHDVLPQLDSAAKISIEGMIDKTVFRVDFDHYGNSRMSVSIRFGGDNIGITAEEKKYHTGEKSKVDISSWTPTKVDIDRHVEFIENAFKGTLLPIPEKKPQRIKGNDPPSAECLPEMQEPAVAASNKELEIPCLACANDSENGGGCSREHFSINPEGTAYVCENKVPLTSDEAVRKAANAEIGAALGQ
jgi:ParB/RepB/Spo0J family partition protein